jgi:hypothetical protein
MTCNCNLDPCICPPDSDHDNGPPPTLCDLDRRNNVWVEGADDTRPGICLLDTLEEHQVTYILQRDPVARADLLKVTSNAYLRNLANITPALPTNDIEGDIVQKEMGRDPMTLYTVFRGIPPFNQ